jgi:hypothetical protein
MNNNKTWSNLLSNKIKFNYPYLPKTYLAYNEQIKTNDDHDCLTVNKDGKLSIKPCLDNNSQKFNYVYEDSKLYFTKSDSKIPNSECLFVDDDNYIKIKKCDQDKMFWIWNQDKQISDYISGSCMGTNANNNIIAKKCSNVPKFNINFTDMGQKICENNDIGGCGKYNTLDNSVFSDVYGAKPTTDQKYKPFVTTCATDIKKIMVDNNNNNIGFQCRDNNCESWLLKKNATKEYYNDTEQVYKTNYGFSGLIIDSDQNKVNKIYPFSKDYPFVNDKLPDRQTIFSCPSDKIISQLAGLHNDTDIKSLLIKCSDPYHLDTQSDIVFSNLTKILQLMLKEDYSRFLFYKEIKKVSEISKLNEYTARSSPGSDNIVLIKIIPSQMEIHELNSLYIATDSCDTKTIDFDIKGDNYETISDCIHQLLNMFDTQMDNINVSDVKNFIVMQKFLPIDINTPQIVGFFVTLTNCSNTTIFIDDMLKTSITNNKPMYIIVYNSNVCFRNNLTKNNKDFGNISINNPSSGQLGIYNIIQKFIHYKVIEPFSIKYDVFDSVLIILVGITVLYLIIKKKFNFAIVY